jgi:Skp family chaperone for outer membrane proteins
MTQEEELKQLRVRCANLEASYREAYPETVKRARQEAKAELINAINDYAQSTHNARKIEIVYNAIYHATKDGK